MLCFSGIETSILRHSKCVFCLHRVKKLFSRWVEEKNRQGMYMHASTLADSRKAATPSHLAILCGIPKVITAFRRAQQCAYF